MRRVHVLWVSLALLLAISGNADAVSFQGEWTSNLGTMLLHQDGTRVEGTYSGSSGRIAGTVSGNVLKGTYWWKGKTGVFELTMNGDGSSFQGTWRRESANGTWSGRKTGELESSGGSSPTDDSPPGSDEPTVDRADRIRQLGEGLTQYTIWSSDEDGYGDSSGQQINMGPHTYCALTYVMSGGFNSACGISVRGKDWVLIARDPGAPDPFTGESQGCSAICFDR